MGEKWVISFNAKIVSGFLLNKRQGIFLCRCCPRHKMYMSQFYSKYCPYCCCMKEVYTRLLQGIQWSIKSETTTTTNVAPSFFNYIIQKGMGMLTNKWKTLGWRLVKVLGFKRMPYKILSVALTDHKLRTERRCSEGLNGLVDADFFGTLEACSQL